MAKSFRTYNRHNSDDVIVVKDRSRGKRARLADRVTLRRISAGDIDADMALFDAVRRSESVSDALRD